MKIEVPALADASALAALDQAQPFSAHWSEADWRAELGYPAARVWCAKLEEKIVGFITVRGAVGQFEITNLAVDKNYTRRGIGSVLLAHAFTQLSAAQITLEVSVQNLPARALYEKNGFKVVSVRRQFYPDGADALLMERTL